MEKSMALHFSNSNLFHPRMLCSKFGLNWLSGSGEEDENVKSLQTEGQQAIRKAYTSFQLWWAKKGIDLYSLKYGSLFFQHFWSNLAIINLYTTPIYTPKMW